MSTFSKKEVSFSLDLTLTERVAGFVAGEEREKGEGLGRLENGDLVGFVEREERRELWVWREREEKEERAAIVAIGAVISGIKER